MSEPFYDPSDRPDDDLTREEFESAMKPPMDDGGPAFPVTDSRVLLAIGLEATKGIPRENTAERDAAFTAAKAKAGGGMSLRDWFAGMALEGMLACPDGRGSFATFAKDAFGYADAMLAERKEGA